MPGTCYTPGYHWMNVRRCEPVAGRQSEQTSRDLRAVVRILGFYIKLRETQFPHFLAPLNPRSQVVDKESPGNFRAIQALPDRGHRAMFPSKNHRISWNTMTSGKHWQCECLEIWEVERLKDCSLGYCDKACHTWGETRSILIQSWEEDFLLLGQVPCGGPTRPPRGIPGR